MTNADYANMMMVLRRIETSVDVEGLTKREYFAAMAMQGIIAANHRYDELGFDTEMQHAVAYADALIEALNK